MLDRRIEMTVRERQRYVRWWLDHSGLTPRELRRVATGIWSDRLVDVAQDDFARWHPAENTSLRALLVEP